MKGYPATKPHTKFICTLLIAFIILGVAAVPASAKDSSVSAESALAAIGLDYDSEKKTIEASNGAGLFFTGFDYDASQNIFYSSQYCWQRSFGYSTFYDDMAPFVFMYFDCLRFYFDYGGKSWLIQGWKGQYGITTGCELGIYYKSPDREIKHYDCVADEDMLPVSIKLFHNGENLFVREMEKHWWKTGFIVFQSIPAEELRMDFSIKFPNKNMLNAFSSSITADMNIKYSIKDTTFNCQWLESPTSEPSAAA